VVAQPDEIHANKQLLCWSGMTDTEHTTSGSNEEECTLPRRRDAPSRSPDSQTLYTLQGVMSLPHTLYLLKLLVAKKKTKRTVQTKKSRGVGQREKIPKIRKKY